MEKYEIVIGLEIHAELCTESKLFCNCAYTFGASANDCTCPICLGMPGTLPVVNRRAVEFAVRAGLAMECEITPSSKFDRRTISIQICQRTTKSRNTTFRYAKTDR